MKKILSVLITISLAITLTNVNVFANEKSENIYTNNSMNLANNDELRVLSEEERIVIGKKVIADGGVITKVTPERSIDAYVFSHFRKYLIQNFVLGCPVRRTDLIEFMT